MTELHKKVDFGGGCFWCTEAVFRQLKGVLKVECGYSGGKVVNPTYIEVSQGNTGHAEMVEITYNPNEISFDDLLKIHLGTHNPTIEINEGMGWGSQYRSIIFYRTEEEKQISMAIIEEMQNVFSNAILTDLQMFEHFYKAEHCHQDYYNRNPNGQFCQSVIEPKLSKVRGLYKDRLKHVN